MAGATLRRRTAAQQRRHYQFLAAGNNGSEFGRKWQAGHF